MLQNNERLYHLGQVPRVSLGFFPTPLHRLERLSESLGYDIYCKRDDLTGFNIYGGNKIRKLEYLMGDAVAKGCDTVLTYGATQSNHAMETIAAARKCGLTPIVYLVSLVEPDPEDARANLLLDAIFGAEVHIVPAEGRTEAEASREAFALGEKRIIQLEGEGHKCYNIPEGGATEVGSAAYIAGYGELLGQLEGMGGKMEYLFTSTGTGGTMAGLAAGKAFFGDDTEIIGIQVSPKDETYRDRIVRIADRALQYVGADDIQVSRDSFRYDGRFYGEGYEIPSSEVNEAIRWLARTEGLLTDPVYSGKGFYGMVEHLRNGEIPKGSTVVFLHTGGTTALFAEKKIIGDLVSRS